MIRKIPKEIWLGIAVALVLAGVVATPFYFAGCGRTEAETQKERERD